MTFSLTIPTEKLELLVNNKQRFERIAEDNHKPSDS